MQLGQRCRTTGFDGAWTNDSVPMTSAVRRCNRSRAGSLPTWRLFDSWAYAERAPSVWTDTSESPVALWDWFADGDAAAGQLPEREEQRPDDPVRTAELMAIELSPFSCRVSLATFYGKCGKCTAGFFFFFFFCKK